MVQCFCQFPEASRKASLFNPVLCTHIQPLSHSIPHGRSSGESPSRNLPCFTQPTTNSITQFLFVFFFFLCNISICSLALNLDRQSISTLKISYNHKYIFFLAEAHNVTLESEYETNFQCWRNSLSWLRWIDIYSFSSKCL